LLADKYEENNTEATAYNLPVALVNNADTITTDLANNHSYKDVDYYKVVLPGSGKYIISAKVFDRYNSTFGCDVKFSTKINRRSWSYSYDSEMQNALKVSGGDTVFFKVDTYSSTTPDSGSYILNIYVKKIVKVLDVSSSSLDFDSYGNDTVAYVRSNIDWTVSSNQSWCAVDLASGSGNGRIGITVNENTTHSDRTATLTIAGGEITKSITISQKGKFVEELNVSCTSLAFNSNANDTVANVLANVDWTVSSNQAWCVVNTSKTSGTKNGSIGIVVAENTTQSERTATIAIKGSDITTYITVVQKGRI
jgi:hypothetical protein